MLRLVVRSIVPSHDLLYHRSSGATIDRTLHHRISRVLARYATIARTIGRRMQRSVDRTIGRRPSRMIVHQSLIATTSRTISCDGSCHRYSPIVRGSVTTRRDRSRYATGGGDRRNNCRSVAPWPNRNQTNRTIQKSYDLM